VFLTKRLNFLVKLFGRLRNLLFICTVEFNQIVKPKGKMTEKQTEQKILDAARKLFMKKGMGATRMQEIADEAGINKALLHYYFRSKQKLFEHTFKEAFGHLQPRLQVLTNQDLPLEKRIRLFISEYIDVIEKNRFLPLFIMQEIQRDPGNLYSLMTSSGFDPRQLLPLLAQAIGKTDAEAFELILNTISLIVFPYVGQPLITHVFFHGDQEEFENALEGRKERIADLIIKTLKNQ